MYTLGINISHHASVCLLRDGEVVYYMEDDRISRKKEEEWTPFSPMHSLSKVKEITSHVDHLVIVSFGRVGIKFPPYLEISPPYKDSEVIDRVMEVCEEIGLSWGEKLFLPEHHLIHASNAFFSTTFKEAVAIVQDGGGYYFPEHPLHREVESTYVCQGGEITPLSKHYGLYSHYTLDSVYRESPGFVSETSVRKKVDEVITVSPTSGCGNLFNLLGTLIDIPGAGKLMGLSPYGSHREYEADFFEYQPDLDVFISDPRSVVKLVQSFLPSTSSQNSYDREVTFADKAFVCHVLQRETCKHTLRLIGKAIAETQTKHIVLSGGYFLNCVNNYKYVQAFPDVTFYVDPLAHDGGTAMGAARYMWHVLLGNKERHPLKHLYLG